MGALFLEWRGGGRERGEIFYNPMIRSQSFRESLPKAVTFTSASQFVPHLLPLGGTGRPEEAEFGHFPSLMSIRP